MNDFALARVLHVLGVVLWIGGVAMVTMVLLPATRRLKAAEEQVTFFEQIESRFATQSRITTLVTGLSGFYIGSSQNTENKARLRCASPIKSVG